MAQRVFRVCRSIYARMDGEGARIAGGRGNSPGRAVVYMAESVSLAVLENLVYMAREDFPSNYVCVGASIPDRILTLTDQDLNALWGHRAPRVLGDQWLDSNRSAVLRVASVVVAAECNYLLNPRHPQFAEIVVEIPVPFRFDPRLFGAVRPPDRD